MMTKLKSQEIRLEESRDPVYDDYAKEVVLYVDGRENLVVRKSPLAPKDDSKDDWLRTNIFHTAWSQKSRPRVPCIVQHFENKSCTKAMPIANLHASG